MDMHPGGLKGGAEEDMPGASSMANGQWVVATSHLVAVPAIHGPSAMTGDGQ
jgi:hypothetical protein